MPEDRTGKASAPGADACLAASLLAVDPIGLGGVALRARSGPAREAWLDLLRHLLPESTPFRRLPSNIGDDRLLGGLDLAATLSAGRPIAERGVLADADGGILLLPIAERLSTATAARIANAMDKGAVAVERDGLARQFATRFGVVALDEGIEPDEQPPAALLDRLACHVDLEGLRESDIAAALCAAEIEEARTLLPAVRIGTDAIGALCSAAFALGVFSLNAPFLASRVARAAAALEGESEAGERHIAVAARLVLAPRATFIPMVEEQEPAEQHQNDTPEPEAENKAEGDISALDDVILAAAQAAIPPDLLARLAAAPGARAASTAGRSGRPQHSATRGRPTGTKRGALRKGARLHVLETLRAAAPWQRLRGRPGADARRIEIRQDDFRIRRFKQRSETVTIFVVDASGSSALHRLGEAKGAVELLLADCYVRRDQVALLAFGGRGPELVLPPTRSLTRAKRRLADLPGGGGTPLGAALDAAAAMAGAIKRKGQTPAIVVLTDGRPNLARDGRPGRAAAEADALAAAGTLRASRFRVLLIDTSKQPEPCAARIAEAMGAQYVPLPRADARALSEQVRLHMPGNAA